jgi:hypothetical protein
MNNITLAFAMFCKYRSLNTSQGQEEATEKNGPHRGGNKVRNSGRQRSEWKGEDSAQREK